MISKIKHIYQTGTLSEKIISGINSRLNSISIKSYRFRSKSIHKNCSKVISNWYINKNKIKILIKNILGDFSNFSEFIDPKQENEIIFLADEYLEHNFNILGSGKVKLVPMDWHTDFKTGFRWKPGKFYKDYIQVDLTNNADVKIPRELSRCHHFLILGQAYLLTNDEKYTKEFINEIIDWIDKNPLMYSINWGCTMDVAIRAVNWIYALGIFITSSLLKNNILKKILISLYEHGYFIYRNPEKSINNNHNHYISDLTGQIYLGILFKELPESKKWLNKGVSELFREMRLQILPSGVNYERSINYNRLVLELFSSAIILLKKNHFEIPSDIYYRLEKMFEFVMFYIKPDGLAPVIGDQDDARLHPFGLQKNIDHRYLLSIGSVLFNRSDFKKYSSGYNPDVFFLLGYNSKKAYDKLCNIDFKLKSKAFSDAGFFIMREKKNYMFINMSGKSRYSEISGGTHTHSDLLSFELFMEDKTFLVDTGSYVYSADPKARRLFRSTSMHNTVVVDRQDQNVIKEEILWDFERNAIPKLNQWESNNRYDFFDGEHSGYQRLKEPVVHRRNIYFDKKLIKWEITDYLTGLGQHYFEWYFHFDVGIDFIIKENRVLTTCSDGVNISIIFYSEHPFNIEKERGWVSKAYGEKEQAKVLKISLRWECPIQMKTIIEKE